MMEQDCETERGGDVYLHACQRNDGNRNRFTKDVLANNRNLMLAGITIGIDRHYDDGKLSSMMDMIEVSPLP